MSNTTRNPQIWLSSEHTPSKSAALVYQLFWAVGICKRAYGGETFSELLLPKEWASERNLIVFQLLLAVSSTGRPQSCHRIGNQMWTPRSDKLSLSIISPKGPLSFLKITSSPLGSYIWLPFFSLFSHGYDSHIYALCMLIFLFLPY